MRSRHLALPPPRPPHHLSSAAGTLPACLHRSSERPSAVLSNLHRCAEASPPLAHRFRSAARSIDIVHHLAPTDPSGASNKPAITTMSSGSRSMAPASAVLLCLLVVAAQSWGAASAWGGLRSVTGGGERTLDHADGEAEAGVRRYVAGGAGAADLQLRRSEQERAVTRTGNAFTAARRARFLSDRDAGAGAAVNVWPTILGLRSPKQTCDVKPALCQAAEQVASGATTCCNKRCVNISSDKNNCGACSVRVGHGCVCCSGVGVDLKKDVNNCGKCGNKCRGPSPVCSYSICNYNTGHY